MLTFIRLQKGALEELIDAKYKVNTNFFKNLFTKNVFLKFACLIL
jgi:hypothetical protein